MEKNKIKKKRFRDLNANDKAELNCLCCGVSLENTFKRKYCGKCGLYTLKLRGSIDALKRDIRKLRVRLYGQTDGRQRVR